MSQTKLTPLVLAAAILAACPLVHAQTKPERPATVTTVMAAKSPFITGLQEPQGLELNGKTLLIAEYKGGKVSEYTLDGKLKGVLATGLKNPAGLVLHNGDLYITERKADRLVKIGPDKKVVPVGSEVVEPVGITKGVHGEIYVVAHTTSKIYRLDKNSWKSVYEAKPDETGTTYGYRCLAFDSGTLLLSDEGSGQIYLLTTSGRLAPWAKGIEDPSGVTVGPDGSVYATDEKLGGRLLRISPEGVPTVVADGLGRPRGILFLDKTTVLVSDRNGTVWKVILP